MWRNCAVCLRACTLHQPYSQVDADTHFDPLLPAPEIPFQNPSLPQLRELRLKHFAASSATSNSVPNSAKGDAAKDTVIVSSDSDSSSSSTSSNDNGVGLLTLATAARSGSGGVVQLHPRSNKFNPIPPANSKRRRMTQTESDKVVQLNDVLLVLPSTIQAESWAEGKSHLISLMKNTGHMKAFIRTSKAPPSHNGYWAKVICPECPSFIIGSASTANLEALSVNSQGHNVCTRVSSSQPAPEIPVPTAAITPATIHPIPSVVAAAKRLCENCADVDHHGSFVPCSGNHSFCTTCFDFIVLKSITGDKAQSCMDNNCIIACISCFASTFNMRQYAQY